MTKMTLTAIALIAFGFPAFAQSSNSESQAQAGSQSSIYQEAGDAIRQAPGMGAPGLMHTGPCRVSTSGGASGPGFGITFGGGSLDEACDTRAGAAALASLLGNDAAVEHLCLDPKMRSTLEPMGRCTIHRTAAEPRPTSYVTCDLDAATNQLLVRQARGFTFEQASADCLAAYGF